ncbi:unnamed protein product, partial [marine sediment metagenome]
MGKEPENKAMTIRLEHEDKIYGVLSVCVLKDFSIESEEQSLFEEIAGDIGFALHDIKLEEERKRLEENIRKLSQSVEQSPASVIITDIQGNVEYVNPKFTQITGYTIDEVKGQNPRILKSGEKSPEEYKELWDTITKGKTWHGEFHNKKKNGELYWEDATIGPIKNEKGEITHFLALKEDITNQKRLEEDRKILFHDKEERIRELKCLYGVADSISKRTYLEEIFQDVADLIPPGWQYPDITRGRVMFDGKEYISADFKGSNLKQSSEI